MYNFAIAQVFGALGVGFNVLSMQMKTKKHIMLMLLGLNLASALNFIFLDQWSGSLVSFFGAFETIINYVFESKGKKIPIVVIAFYVVINITLGLSAYHTPLDIIPIVAALLFCAAICVPKESQIRKIMLANQTSWLIYDGIVGAYMFAVSNVLSIISTSIAIYRFDHKKSKTHKRLAK